MEESAAARKARLKALREEAEAVGGGADQQQPAAGAAAAAGDEPVLKFRNYAAPKDIQHEKVGGFAGRPPAAARPPACEVEQRSFM